MGSVASNPFVAAPGLSLSSSAPQPYGVSTDNGLNFADVLSGFGAAANGVANVVSSFKGKTTAPAVIAPALPPQPVGGASSGFKMDSTTLMVAAGIGLVVLLVMLK